MFTDESEYFTIATERARDYADGVQLTPECESDACVPYIKFRNMSLAYRSVVRELKKHGAADNDAQSLAVQAIEQFADPRVSR